MIIYLTGTPKYLRRKDVWDFLGFVDRSLGLYRYKSPEVQVHLAFRKDFAKKTGCWGWCVEWTEPREFIVEIEAAQPMEQLLKTVAHEFVHVKQESSGLMNSKDQKVYLRRQYEEHWNIPHYRRPWERDAFLRQDLIFEKYKKHCEGDVVCSKRRRRTEMNKTEKLLKALKGGAELSTAQIRSRFGFESDSGVSSVIRNLRSQGYSVYANTRNGVTKYRIGTAPRVAVATAFAVHGSEIFTR